MREDTLRSNTLNEITRIYLFELQDLEKGHANAVQQIALAKKINFKKGLANGYLNNGIYYRTTGNYGMAHYFDNEALKIMQAIGNKKGESSCYGNIGMTYINQGNYKLGLEYSFKGLKIKEEIDDKRGVAISYNNIGAVYYDQGNYTEALNCYLKSLKLREETKDSMGMAMSFNNIGNIFNSQAKLDAALTYYKKALSIQEKLGGKKQGANTCINIGNVYSDKGQYTDAFIYHTKGLKAYEAINDKKGIAVSYNSIGSDYTFMKKNDQALVYQLKSFALCKEIGYNRGLINAGGGIGNLYEEQKKYQEALDYYREMLSIAKEMDSKEGMRDAYENYASVYRKLEQFDKALEYTQLLYEIKDSILNKENFKQVTELNTRYETEKKEKEILLLTKDQQLSAKILKEQQLVRWGLTGGMVLLFISVFSVYRRYRFKLKANLILQKQKEEIQQQNVLITDSNDYAKSIQEVVLPTSKQLHELFPQHFILYRPKSIVSGDFYWVSTIRNQLVCAVADCTGHGVPGAFMSLLGYNMLENVAKRSSALEPSAILTELNEEVVTRLSHSVEKETVRHGMDIALITIDKKTNMLYYAGAHNSLYIIRNGALTELKANKVSIGFIKNAQRTLFDNQQFQLEKGDLIYLFTDGFPDQIGGPNRKKFYYPPFRELLIFISSLPLEQQQKKLAEAHVAWKGGHEQTDDLLIIGIRY